MAETLAPFAYKSCTLASLFKESCITTSIDAFGSMSSNISSLFVVCSAYASSLKSGEEMFASKDAA
jgi:hypothetical protein